MSNNDKKILIVGAGIAGLGSGYRLSEYNFDCTICEAANQIGGFATSFYYKGCIFDYGPHAFHAPDRETLNFFLNLMGDETLILKKKVEIKFRNKYFDYPIKPVNLLRNLDFFVLVKCIGSFLSEFVRKAFEGKDTDDSLESFYIALYGKSLYQLFFENYTQKVWGVHPGKLSNGFLKHRLPAKNIFQLAYQSLKDTLGLQKGTLAKDNEVSLQYYPRKGSIRFPEKMRDFIVSKGGEILLNKRVHKIHHDGKRITGVSVQNNQNTETIPCDLSISTIPLTDFVKSMDPPPPQDILDSALKLRFRAMIIVCMVVNIPQVIHCDALYFHERIFNRMGQMNTYSPETVPPGKSAITIELTCFPDDAMWKWSDDILVQKILDELDIEGFHIHNQVEGYFVLRSEYGYPIPTLGYEKKLSAVLHYLHQIQNLYIGGREGLFTYIQMFHALQMGFKIADHILSGKEKPPLEFDSEGKQFAGKEPFFV